MMRVEEASDAKLGIARIIRYLVDADAVHAAERFIDALSETSELLARFPKIGPVAESTRNRRIPIRHIQLYRHADWLILYQVHSESVLILRILHASQDIESALNPRSDS
ncbi:MAG: type II toxin-antitoxin system RelE/ParE family toxin [Gemmataceae bacterium]|nr:type II toxin-antitoxin system RelE/ParE family toxin [Gemmataceae bacterium]